jgi:hypothetical protein
MSEHGNPTPSNGIYTIQTLLGTRPADFYPKWLDEGYTMPKDNMWLEA